MKRPPVIGAVEIGTSNVKVLVGEITAQRGLKIIGKGTCETRGIAKGEIIDFKAVNNCTHTAIYQAEQYAGHSIDGIYFAETGSHLDSFFNESMVTVKSSDNIVSPSDLERVKEEAKDKELPPNRLYIHHLLNHCILDGEKVVDPVGMYGEKLSIGYWCITGDENKVRNQVGIFNGMSLDVDDMILSSLASGMMMASHEEKKQGILIVDMGKGTTDYAVYKNGYVVCCGVIPVGGDHITNDLRLGLRINSSQAEYLKCTQAQAWIEQKNAEQRVWVSGDKTIGDIYLPLINVERIVNARVQECFQILRERIESHIPMNEIPMGCVLTGGTSKLRSIERVAAQELGIEVRRGSHAALGVEEQLAQPEYSTALGLFLFALSAGEREDKPVEAPKFSRFIKKLKRLAT